MSGAGADVFAVWGYVIAKTVQGQVDLNPKVVAALIGMSVDRVQAAIDYLCAPDPNSRNPDEDGRRLVKEGQFTYRQVSHFIYRGMKDEDERREYNRDKKRESRARKRAAEKEQEAKQAKGQQ